MILSPHGIGPYQCGPCLALEWNGAIFLEEAHWQGHCVPYPSSSTSQPRGLVTSQEFDGTEILLPFWNYYYFFLYSSDTQHVGHFQVASDLKLLLLGPLNRSLGSFSLVTLQSSLRPRKPPTLCFYLTLALQGGEGPSLGCLPCSLLLLAGD